MSLDYVVPSNLPAAACHRLRRESLERRLPARGRAPGRFLCTHHGLVLPDKTMAKCEARGGSPCWYQPPENRRASIGSITNCGSARLPESNSGGRTVRRV
jgi:hypothetical protein